MYVYIAKQPLSVAETKEAKSIYPVYARLVVVVALFIILCIRFYIHFSEYNQ